MPLTESEFDELVKATCRHCAAGIDVRWRPETKEYVHDIVRDTGSGRSFSHGFCLATGLRKAYEEKKNG